MAPSSDLLTICALSFRSIEPSVRFRKERFP